jgi:hypothetical protein
LERCIFLLFLQGQAVDPIWENPEIRDSWGPGFWVTMPCKGIAPDLAQAGRARPNAMPEPDFGGRHAMFRWVMQGI